MAALMVASVQARASGHEPAFSANRSRMGIHTTGSATVAVLYCALLLNSTGRLGSVKYTAPQPTSSRTSTDRRMTRTLFDSYDSRL